jgi:hypothetical protein
MSEIYWFRGVERLLIAGAGLFLAYMGYRLFLQMPDKSDAQGRVILPGNISVYVSRVGPGVFFALFGTVLLGVLARMQVTDGPSGPSFATEPTMVGGTSRASNTADSGKLREAIAEMNSHFRQSHSPGDENLEALKNDVYLAVMKLPVMECLWEPKWGPFDDFARWARRLPYSRTNVPVQLKEAVAVFEVGL